MKYYTAEEAAKKLKVSTGHIYELVKRGELKKKEGMGRAVRIPVSELKTRNTESAASRWLKFDENKVIQISTSYGNVRKVLDKKAYLAGDVAKVLNKCDSHVIKKITSNSEIIHLSLNEAKEYGLLSTRRGLDLITIRGIKEYLEKAILASDFDREVFIEELLEIDKEFSSDEVAKEDNHIKVFDNPEFGQVRIVPINNQPWFVGKDVAEILGYAKPRNAITTHVDYEDRKGAPIQGNLGGTQEMTVINESGLYSLILSSKLPTAKKFKRWVTNEVLPTIRKTGGYVDNSEKFVDNYFNNFSPETRKLLLKELEFKNRTLLVNKEKLDKEILENITVIEKIQETLQGDERNNENNTN